MDKLWESMPAENFLAMASNERFLGNRRIKTQHFIGAGKWAQTGEDDITGYHQMRVAHQKYKDNELTEVMYQGHAYGKATIRYHRVDGVWKFAGLTPDIRWTEHDYEKIFQES
jgi:scytalone dehydratase